MEERIAKETVPMKIRFLKIGRITTCLLMVCLAATSFAANDEREQDRVKDAGEVMKEILNIPEDIPQDLLDKAECLVILPSVKRGLLEWAEAMAAAL